jgi:hypothetical protein
MKKNMQKLQGAQLMGKKDQKNVKGGITIFPCIFECIDTGAAFTTLTRCRANCPGSFCFRDCGF